MPLITNDTQTHLQNTNSVENSDRRDLPGASIQLREPWPILSTIDLSEIMTPLYKTSRQTLFTSNYIQCSKEREPTSSDNQRELLSLLQKNEEKTEIESTLSSLKKSVQPQIIPSFLRQLPQLASEIPQIEWSVPCHRSGLQPSQEEVHYKAEQMKRSTTKTSDNDYNKTLNQKHSLLHSRQEQKQRTFQKMNSSQSNVAQDLLKDIHMKTLKQSPQGLQQENVVNNSLKQQGILQHQKKYSEIDELRTLICVVERECQAELKNNENLRKLTRQRSEQGKSIDDLCAKPFKSMDENLFSKQSTLLSQKNQSILVDDEIICEDVVLNNKNKEAAVIRSMKQAFKNVNAYEKKQRNKRTDQKKRIATCFKVGPHTKQLFR